MAQSLYLKQRQIIAISRYKPTRLISWSDFLVIKNRNNVNAVNVINQSKLESETCNLCQTRENVHLFQFRENMQPELR